jgi:hypothetical protein
MADSGKPPEAGSPQQEGIDRPPPPDPRLGPFATTIIRLIDTIVVVKLPVQLAAFAATAAVIIIVYVTGKGKYCEYIINRFHWSMHNSIHANSPAMSINQR